MLENHKVTENPLISYKVKVRTLTDRNVSVADIGLHSKNGLVFRATGSAKRVPGDEFDPGVGDTLAVGRALIALGEGLVSNAESYMGA